MELVVTIAVFSVLIAIALPSFRSMLMNGRMASTTDSLVNSLNYARNTALNQQMNVQVCPLGAVNSSTCGTNWGQGWIVVSLSATGAATLLQTQQLSSNSPVLTGTTSTLIFEPHGMTSTTSLFKLCDPRGAQFARSVEVLATGFIQAGETAGQSVVDNTALACP